MTSSSTTTSSTTAPESTLAVGCPALSLFAVASKCTFFFGLTAFESAVFTWETEAATAPEEEEEEEEAVEATENEDEEEDGPGAATELCWSDGSMAESSAGERGITVLGLDGTLAAAVAAGSALSGAVPSLAADLKDLGRFNGISMSENLANQASSSPSLRTVARRRACSSLSASSSNGSLISTVPSSVWNTSCETPARRSSS
mmetsp:Transcript_9687/g.29865  ORF Transcript_9687/g.29865 Transcript_9687/m.29865 type:complete len:203 (-) Transcript_9687:496-1104(-)